jgi:hypothetical protein
VIPLLFQPLEDEEDEVRLEAVKVIGTLANHGEQQLDIIVAQLIRMRSRVS